MYGNSYRGANSIGYGFSQQYGYSRQFENSQQFGYSQQYDSSFQYGNSQQYGYSRQFEHSCQFGFSKQYGKSAQFGFSKQYGYSCQYGNSQQFGNSNDKNIGDVKYLKSPTSGETITIGSDRTIAVGCFFGTSFYMIDTKRCDNIPKWAYNLHEDICKGIPVADLEIRV